jgi:hypothetical protein
MKLGMRWKQRKKLVPKEAKMLFGTGRKKLRKNVFLFRTMGLIYFQGEIRKQNDNSYEIIGMVT